jgi:hypothetical protein
MPDARSFFLREHHLKLACRLHVGWNGSETGAPGIDIKRPYGNSFVPRDVAEIIGEEWPDENELSASAYEREADRLAERMLTIHREMKVALQIILGNAGATTLPGHYRNMAGPYDRPKWVAC